MNSEDMESLKRARDLVVGVNQQISEKTENQYRRSFARMQEAGETPETMATTCQWLLLLQSGMGSSLRL
jgi:hypothetical protein